MTHTLDETHLLCCQRAAQMLICSVFNALERDRVRDSASPVSGTTLYSPLLHSGSAGMGKSCIRCCSRRRRLSSSSCWATLVTASSWCSLSSFLRQAKKNHTVKVAILCWVLPLKVFGFISSSAVLMNPPFPCERGDSHSCRSDFCHLPNRL